MLKISVWYGAAIWFALLKSFNISPVAEWDWYWFIFLISWPTISDFIERERFTQSRNIQEKQIRIRE